MAETDGLMTIGQVARQNGVAATTLRYYEREGLLAPTARNRAGYRLYDARAVERLRFIRSAQGVGFNLDDIRTLLEFDQDNGQSCRAEVQRLLQRRLDDIDRKMTELKRVRGTLGQALDRCRRSRGQCPVLSDLGPQKNKSKRR